MSTTRPRTPMDRAAAGMEKLSIAASNAVGLAVQTAPQWFALLERAVDIAERGVVAQEQANESAQGTVSVRMCGCGALGGGLYCGDCGGREWSTSAEATKHQIGDGITGCTILYEPG